MAIIAIDVLLSFNNQLSVVENNFAPTRFNCIAMMMQYKIDGRSCDSIEGRQILGLTSEENL